MLSRGQAGTTWGQSPTVSRGDGQGHPLIRVSPVPWPLSVRFGENEAPFNLVPMPVIELGGGIGVCRSLLRKIRGGGMTSETAIEFLQTPIIPEGPLAGQAMRQAVYQQRFIRGALAEGVMVGVLSIGRGNAKTGTSAGIGLGALMGVWDPQPKREIIIAARNRDQAQTAFGFVCGFIEGLPEAEQQLFTIRRGLKMEAECTAYQARQ